MSQMLLYQLRFEPIYQYRLRGGRRLANLLSAPLPGDAPIGEAWLPSDRDDHPSLVADGPLKGPTIKPLLEPWPEPGNPMEVEGVLNPAAGTNRRRAGSDSVA